MGGYAEGATEHLNAHRAACSLQGGVWVSLKRRIGATRAVLRVCGGGGDGGVRGVTEGELGSTVSTEGTDFVAATQT